MNQTPNLYGHTEYDFREETRVQLDRAVTFFIEHKAYTPSSLAPSSSYYRIPFSTDGDRFLVHPSGRSQVVLARWWRDSSVVVLRAKPKELRTKILMNPAERTFGELLDLIKVHCEVREILAIETSVGALEHHQKLEEYILNSAIKGV